MMKLEVFPIPRVEFDCRESVNPWSCEQCNFSSHVLPSLIRHKEAGCGSQEDYSNFMLDAYKCRECKFISCSCIIATKHETECWMLGETICEDKTPLLICSHCQFTISYKNIIFDKFECGSQECRYTYTKIEELKEHATFVHLPDECLKFLFANDGVDSIEQFYCEQCGQELNSKRITTLLTCHKCGYKSKHQFGIRQRTMNKHLRSPVGDQYFECQECPFKTKTRQNLKLHKIWKHTPRGNIKWFECQECEFRSKDKRNVILHRIQKHTSSENMEWFECGECAYKGKSKRRVTVHRFRMHTPNENMKWFECEECTYKSKTKYALKQHKLYKHTPCENIKWFECEECAYKGKTKRGLKLHKNRKHTPT